MTTVALSRFRTFLSTNQMDGAIITKPVNRRYLSGFTGTSGVVVVTQNNQYFITDFRYTEQAKEQCPAFNILTTTTEKTLYDYIRELQLKTIAYEDDHLTVSEFNVYLEKLSESELKPLKGILTDLRAVKQPFEIEFIRKAASIADKAFEHILNFLRPGVSERDVAVELEHYMKKLGASGLSFDSIVASGLRSALPHGVASDKLIEDGDFVTLDFGCIYNGYCSDMTRTVVIGKASDKQKEVYQTVLDAQIKALEYIKPGNKGYDVDLVARNSIEQAGYGDYFGHGLGHGVGLEIHENPYLSFRFKDHVLEAGCVITDEPGIYIPGFGGVRIEDLIVVGENGIEILSKSPKHLIEL